MAVVFYSLSDRFIFFIRYTVNVRLTIVVASVASPVAVQTNLAAAWWRWLHQSHAIKMRLLILLATMCVLYKFTYFYCPTTTTTTMRV